VDMTRVGLDNRVPEKLAQARNPVLVLCGQKEYREMLTSTCEIATTLQRGEAFQVIYPYGVPMREQHNWSMTFPDLFTKTVRTWIEDGLLPAELIPL
jgi:hypothetical protein